MQVVAATRALLPGAVCTACGSYRRGAQTCGDVDILITHPDGASHEHILPKLVDALEADGLLTDHLVQSAHDGSHQKYMGVCQLPPTDGAPSVSTHVRARAHTREQLHRRLDIIAIPYAEYAPALIYFTGSAHFTRSIYARAKSMGMRLNQHGLRANVVRAGGTAINAGQSIDTPTEQSIFDALKLEWRTPDERDHA
jgi:DNA polymerase lambda